MHNDYPTRYSVRELERLHARGNKKPLEDLMRAWKGIKELPPDDLDSFFRIGGYHGEPFIYRPWVDKLSEIDTYVYWGGYCNHGNVLFPTWHRVYVYRLEQALQRIVPGVMMAYWDETSVESLAEGIPHSLTDEKFTFSDDDYNGELKGKTIDNPLRSFVLPVAVSDEMNVPSQGDINHQYAKPKGYETVRYPLSGLVGTPEARQATKAHNDQYPDPIGRTQKLNENVIQWLIGKPPTEVTQMPPGQLPKKLDDEPQPAEEFSIFLRYLRCLDAPNYTVFSNTTSAAAWNHGSEQADIAIPLEDPHNDVHLAVGGFDLIIEGKEDQDGILTGANGDMGENNTAALDPIFFFHHCNVDRMFWVWQKKQQQQQKLEVIAQYSGTSSTDSQGPTPGFAPNSSLDLNSPLHPFTKTIDGMEVPYTSEDCIDIENQLNFTYSIGSLDPDGEEMFQAEKASYDDRFSSKTLVVTKIDRALFQGSFVLRAYAEVGDETYYLGHHSVLSRRNVVKCANCLTHLEVNAFFPLSNVPAEIVDSGPMNSAEATDSDPIHYKVQIHHRGEKLHPNLDIAFHIKG
ncbi:tyrosinase family protein [Leptothoe sp. LEGE 181152]|nr:tyrosinase family protein [Leptothoe sp. LEGE 181152]